MLQPPSLKITDSISLLSFSVWAPQSVQVASQRGDDKGLCTVPQPANSHKAQRRWEGVKFFLIYCCLWFISVSSISAPVGIMSCELSKLEQPFLLPPGSSVVPLGRAERPHACLHLFLLAEPGSQQHRPQPFLLPWSCPLSQLSPHCTEASYPLSSLLPSVKFKLGGASGDTIVSGQLSVSSSNNNSSSSSSSNTGRSWRSMTVDTPGGGEREGRLSTRTAESLVQTTITLLSIGLAQQLAKHPPPQ